MTPMPPNNMATPAERTNAANETATDSARTQRLSVLSLVLLVLLVVENSAFWGIMYYQYRQLAERGPEQIINKAMVKFDEQHEELAAKLAKKIEDSAPEIAAAVSHSAIENIPTARQQLEHLIVQQVENGLDGVTEISAEQFRKFLRANHAAIEEQLEAVRDFPDKGQDYVLKMESDIEKSLDIDIRKQAKELVSLQTQLNNRMDRLLNAENLDTKEMLEKRMIRILRSYN